MKKAYKKKEIEDREKDEVLEKIKKLEERKAQLERDLEIKKDVDHYSNKITLADELYCACKRPYFMQVFPWDFNFN